MQTDEEIGKVAAAVPVIICILCTVFVQYSDSLLSFTAHLVEKQTPATPNHQADG